MYIPIPFLLFCMVWLILYRRNNSSDIDKLMLWIGFATLFIVLGSVAVVILLVIGWGLINLFNNPIFIRIIEWTLAVVFYAFAAFIIFCIVCFVYEGICFVYEGNKKIIRSLKTRSQRDKISVIRLVGRLVGRTGIQYLQYIVYLVLGLACAVILGAIAWGLSNLFGNLKFTSSVAIRGIVVGMAILYFILLYIFCISRSEKE